MKLINDYIEKIGGPDKMIHRLVGHNTVLRIAFVGLLVGTHLSPNNILAIVIIVMCFMMVGLLAVAVFSELKEKKDRKEPGNFYDKKDLEAGIIGGVTEMALVSVILTVYAVIIVLA